MANIVTSSFGHQRRNTKSEEITIETTKSSSLSATLSTTAGPASDIVYDVEHLATFSMTTGSHETNRGSANNNVSNGKIKPEFGSGKQNATTTPKVALQRLFELEKLSGIWTQRMQIELRGKFMLIVDCETNSVVEKFNRECVTRPEAFNQYNDIYNNIVVFVIQQFETHVKSMNKEKDLCVKEIDTKEDNYQIKEDEEEEFKSQLNSDSNQGGELHIFQCVSHKAQQLVSDILNWKLQSPSSDQIMTNSSRETNTNCSANHQKKKIFDDQESASSRDKTDQKDKRKPTSTAIGKPVVTVASSASTSENVPIVNVNVKETVQVFNQIAALREKSKPTSPTDQTRPLSDASAASTHSISVCSTTTATGPEPTPQAPLSPGGQLYKQRSIRVTLAPKFTSGTGVKLQPANEEQSVICLKNEAQTSSNNSCSTTSTSSSVTSSEAKLSSSSYHLNSHHSNQAVAGKNGHAGNNHRDVEQTQQTSSNGVHNSARSSHDGHQHHQVANQNQVGHHKSSKSHSRSQQQRTQQSDSSRSHASSSSQSQLDQVTTNESYVSVLNHCFDDIEKFIIRLQQAVAAFREIQAKRKFSKRSSQINEGLGKGDAIFSKSGASGLNSPMTTAELAMLNARARGPNEDDYFEILSKFKLAFNLLAKLKGCIHEPNAPELVHFLFTPLAIIIESARNATPPIDPTLVGIPYLNQDALDLLSNCCTSKESDMWISLGPNWTHTIDMSLLKASRLPSSFQPIFSDGWAPIIGELELIGLVAPTSLNSSDCVASAKLNDNHNNNNSNNHNNNIRHHHHKEGRVSQPSYMLDESPSGPINVHSIEHSAYSADINNVGSDGSKAHLSNKDHKKRNAPAPPISRHHDISEPVPPQPYITNKISSVPYGFMHDSNIDIMNREIRHGPYKVLDHSTHSNIKFNVTEGQAPRRVKQSSRHHNSDYHLLSNHDTSNYPATSLQRLSTDEDSQFDVALANQNESVLDSHDYSVLHNHYMDEHHSKGAPGPSQNKYRGDKRSSYKHDVSPHKNSHILHNQHTVLPPFETTDHYLNEADQEAMVLDLGPAQTEWLFELQSREAMIVRVLFTRDANNDKELSVRRGEILEILDDTRKWWRARNIDLQVAHVPHTIVAIMQGYQTLDELLANNPSDMASEEPHPITSQRFSRRELQPANYNQHQWHARDDKRNSKSVGAFRYF